MSTIFRTHCFNCCTPTLKLLRRMILLPSYPLCVKTLHYGLFYYDLFTMLIIFRVFILRTSKVLPFCSTLRWPRLHLEDAFILLKKYQSIVQVRSLASTFCYWVIFMYMIIIVNYKNDIAILLEINIKNYH